MRRASLLLLAGVALAACGCRRREDAGMAEPLLEVFRQRAQAEGLTRAQTDGKRLFEHYCTTCHGEDGKGDGQNAYNLDPAPADFADSLASHLPGYWRQIIEGGSAAVGRSSLCPPWGRSLASDDVDDLVAYLTVLAQPPPEPDAGR